MARRGNDLVEHGKVPVGPKDYKKLGFEDGTMDMHANIQSGRESRLGSLDLKDRVVCLHFISGHPVAAVWWGCFIALPFHAPRRAGRMHGGGCTVREGGGSFPASGSNSL